MNGRLEVTSRLAAPVPFLHLVKTAEGVQANGQTSFFVGSRIPDAPGDQGYFVDWSWDGNTVHVRSEPWGFAPVFFHSTANEFIVSTQIDAVLARRGRATLDFPALAAFMRLGFFLGDDTPWQGISAIPRSGLISWAPGSGLAVLGDWVCPPAQDSTREQAVHRYASLFSASVARRARNDEKIVMPLSGGRDSRHILFELLKQRRTPDLCITTDHFPERNNEDIRIASQLCAQLRLTHRRVRQPLRRVSNDSRRVKLTNYGSEEHTWAMSLVDQLLPAGRWATYDGLAGDVLSAGLFLDRRQLSLYRDGHLETLARELCVQWSSTTDILPCLSSHRVAALLAEEVAIERIRRELEIHAALENPLTAFYFWNRTRREIAEYSFSMISRGGTGVPVAPFLDRDLVEYLLSLPAALFIDKDFHDETLRRAYPEWAAIPFEKKEAAPAQSHSARLYWRLLGADLALFFILGGDDGLTNRRQISLKGLKAFVRARPWHLEWLAGKSLMRLHLLRSVGLRTAQL